MAFTYCTNCGEKIDDSEVRCPHCGHVRGQERGYTYGQEQHGGQSQYGTQNNQNGYNPNGYNPNGYNPNGYNPNGYNPNGYNPNGYNPNGYNPNGNNPNGYNPNGYNPNGYNPNGYNPNGYNPNGYNPNGYNPNGYNPNGYNPYGQYPFRPQKRPISVGVLVLSILNIILGLCGIPMIFGIIGIVFAISAQTLPEKQAADKIKAAYVLNLVGLALMAISVASFIALLLMS